MQCSTVQCSTVILNVFIPPNQPHKTSLFLFLHIIFPFVLGMTLCHENDACPGNDAKLVRCVMGSTLNSSVVVQGMTVQLRSCLRFRACG